MRQKLNFWVIGGDMRQAKLASLLAGDGHTVHTFAQEREALSNDILQNELTLGGIKRSHCIILPLPVAYEGSMLNAPLSGGTHPLAEIFDAIDPLQTVCAGMVPASVHELGASRGIVLHDYFVREELAVRNAVPTAEGALQLAFEEMPITLHGARALVIGNGRIGKLLAQKLSALCANVTVAARSHTDFALIDAAGHKPADTRHLQGALSEYDVIFNTVPFRVLGEDELKGMNPDCLLIDLASKPGGADG